jgi:hypothetical protein
MFCPLLLLLGLQLGFAISADKYVRRQDCSASSTPTVTVKNGTYTGIYSPGYDQDFFLGMPYAQVSPHTACYKRIMPITSRRADDRVRKQCASRKPYP